MRRPTIRVGLFGFGRAGKAVAQELIRDEQIDLVWVARRNNDLLHSHAGVMLGMDVEQGELLAMDEKSAEQIFREHPVDFVVDFSGEDTLSYYGRAAARFGVGIVSAVSHYPQKQLQLLSELGRKTRVLYSPNITLGVNFLMVAAQAMRRMAPHADVEIVEEHFRGKQEVSGTAMRIAEALDLDPVRQVNSIRVGGIVGRHEVIFGFPFQTLRLVHESISRNAFGQGALYALKRLAELEQGFYTMEQLIREEFSLS
ncbi:MAG TPA: dihydrodipicolinate reductase C-terminal domain-containing protein [Moraxellaceae bacterium]